MYLYLFVLCALAITLSVQARNVTLSLLTDSSNAKCLDGSVAGYYFQEASTERSSKKWVIYLNGGGECANQKGCSEQAVTKLGSSKYFAPESNANGWFLGSDNCEYNPDLCEWNHVFDPYCSQDLHSGQMTEPSDSTWGYQFSGHHILAATLDAMDAKHGMQAAEEIILSGASAGGIGVWMNVDYIKKRYPHARVTGVSIAGFYFFAQFYTGTDARQWDPQGTMADFREPAWPATYALYDAYVNEGCKAAREAAGESPGACMLANEAFEYVESPVFVVQSLSDEVVLQWHDMLPDVSSQPVLLPEEKAFMLEWGKNMTSFLTAPSRRFAGVFAAACWVHTGFSKTGPMVDGMNYRKAFFRYYFSDGVTGNQKNMHLDDYTNVMGGDCDGAE